MGYTSSYGWQHLARTVEQYSRQCRLAASTHTHTDGGAHPIVVATSRRSYITHSCCSNQRTQHHREKVSSSSTTGKTALLQCNGTSNTPPLSHMHISLLSHTYPPTLPLSSHHYHHYHGALYHCYIHTCVSLNNTPHRYKNPSKPWRVRTAKPSSLLQPLLQPIRQCSH